MTRAGLLTLLSVLPAVAAPLPEAERERLTVELVYGDWTDPVGGCSYRTAGGRVWVRHPGFPCGEPEYEGRPTTAPRFVRRLAGDFTATVRVEVPHQPNGRIGHDSGRLSRFVAAGLMAQDGHGNWAAARKFENIEGSFRTNWASAWGVAGGGVGQHPASEQKDDTGRLFLRLSRVGGTAGFAFSTDGVRWREHERQELGWTGPVTLGVIAENTTGFPVEVAFDRYALTQPKKGPEGTP